MVSRRCLAFVLWCLSGVLSVGLLWGADEKRNVVFIMSDDLRPELSCYGHAQIKTPNIDDLADAGVKFERCYVQYPLCNPSRTSLLTGRYPSTTGVLDNRLWFGALHPEIVSLPKFFQQNGYAALRAGKIFHGGIDDAEAWTEGGEPRPFEGAVSTRQQPPNRQQLSDRMVVLEGDGESHGDYRAATQAIDYLRRYQDKPFFLACGFSKPHSPPTAPQRFYDLYDPDKIPLPVDFAPQPTVPPGFPKASVTRNGDLFIDRQASPEEARRMIQAYCASVTWMDWNVGRVLAELDRLGLREKTIVLFWGDHGYHLGEKGKWSKHGSLFEIGTRVPLIVCVPGSELKGQSCTRIVETLDLYPTLAELCGLTPPAGLEGDSLVSLLRDPSAPWDRPAISMIGSNGRVRGVAVRTDGLRYVRYSEPDGGELLFDEAADPHELHNLAAAPEWAAKKAALAELAAPYFNDRAP